MMYEVVGRSSKKRKFLESIIPKIIDQLNLKSSKYSVLVTLESDCENAGITVPVHNINLFYVVLNPNVSYEALGITLAHEMVHVAQMAKGKLRDGPRGTQVWAGKKFAKSTAYLDRPWEIQAFSKQELLFRRALVDI
jgi:hypothetical protein